MPTKVKCSRCGSYSWLLFRFKGYESVGSEFTGADAKIRCASCGLTSRSDGKLADPEGRLSP